MDSTTLHAGDPAPDLELVNHDNEPRSLATLLGQEGAGGQGVIVYFFPKAFTPGCTTEVCDFRDSREPLAKAGYVLLGVSGDSPATLRDFAHANRVNHDLLSDPDHEAARSWGAWGEKTINGKQTAGPLRSTFVVGRDGRLESAEYNLDAQTHVGALALQLGTPAR